MDREVTGPHLHLWEDRVKNERILIDDMFYELGKRRVISRERVDEGNDIWHFSAHEEGNLTGKAVVVAF